LKHIRDAAGFARRVRSDSHGKQTAHRTLARPCQSILPYRNLPAKISEQENQMKLIVLAAGYATRLYPLTLNQPKPLLTVAGKPMLEHVLDNLTTIDNIDHIYIVTNNKFAGHFQRWSEAYRVGEIKSDITIVNDNSTDDTNKLGAIGDLRLVLAKEKINDDLIVVAGDNLFSHSLKEFATVCREKNAPVLAVYDVGI
jgi:glucose-1-phosphate thymidylyltransferase